MIFEGKSFSLGSSVRVVNDKFGEFREAIFPSLSSLSSTIFAYYRWNIRPPVGTIKLNSDASINNGLAVVAIVAKNNYGEVCGLYVFREKIVVLAAAEAFAILNAGKMFVLKSMPKLSSKT